LREACRSTGWFVAVHALVSNINFAIFGAYSIYRTTLGIACFSKLAGNKFIGWYWKSMGFSAG
jgi:hypothetical protein